MSFYKTENPRKCKRDINIKLTEILLSLIELEIKLKVPKCEIFDPSDFHDFYDRARRYTYSFIIIQHTSVRRTETSFN